MVIFSEKSPGNKLVSRVDETLPWIEKKKGKRIVYKWMHDCKCTKYDADIYVQNTVPIFLMVVLAFCTLLWLGLAH